MATQLQRQRIRPTWRAGLRRGKIRDTMTQYLAERPELAEEIFRLLEESRAVNGLPLPLPPHVRTPFDFDRR
jgi:hypothetical protein